MLKKKIHLAQSPFTPKISPSAFKVRLNEAKRQLHMELQAGLCFYKLPVPAAAEEARFRVVAASGQCPAPAECLAALRVAFLLAL